MENNENFSFTYSAQQQKEVEAIRKKYIPKEEDKMEQLRKLHASATQKAQAASIAIGVIGALALGTGMTQAGLLCGQSVYDHGDSPLPRIGGLSTARDAEAATAHLTLYIEDFAAIHPSMANAEAAIRRIQVYDQCRGTYGAPNEAIAALIDQQFREYGLPLDMTYTGKAYHAMLQMLAGEGWQGKRILFIHTGGAGGLFAQDWETEE